MEPRIERDVVVRLKAIQVLPQVEGRDFVRDLANLITLSPLIFLRAREKRSVPFLSSLFLRHKQAFLLFRGWVVPTPGLFPAILESQPPYWLKPVDRSSHQPRNRAILEPL